MEIKVAIFLLVGLIAFQTLVSCNMEGDLLHFQSTAWYDPNNVLESWDPTLVNPCTWFHVTCNGNNSVVRLDLGNAGISGPILPILGGLRNLQYLEVYGNNISGVIPKELGKLTNLVSLDLYQNQLTGPIPPTLGNIKSLKFLRLNENELTGNIPRRIIDLVINGNLIELNVSHNRLAGTVRTLKPRVTTITQDQMAAM